VQLCTTIDPAAFVHVQEDRTYYAGKEMIGKLIHGKGAIDSGGHQISGERTIEAPGHEIKQWHYPSIPGNLWIEL
jgi:hypothetical protein